MSERPVHECERLTVRAKARRKASRSGALLPLGILWTVLFAPDALQAQPVYRLPVRVHLLTAPSSSAFSTSYDSAQVASLFGVANAIWAQAAIVWDIESIRRTPAPRAATFDSLLQQQIPMAQAPLAAYFPSEGRLERGWNLYLFRDFGRFGGGMFDPRLGGVALAEQGMGVLLDAGGRGGATLAHELGHSLGLGHEVCDDARNILANACWRSGQPSLLTAIQIERARQQAAVGRPTTSIPVP